MCDFIPMAIVMFVYHRFQDIHVLNWPIGTTLDVTKRDVTWRDATWRDVTWRDVTKRDVTWCNVMWRDVTNFYAQLSMRSFCCSFRMQRDWVIFLAYVRGLWEIRSEPVAPSRDGRTLAKRARGVRWGKRLLGGAGVAGWEKYSSCRIAPLRDGETLKKTRSRVCWDIYK